MTDKSLLQIVDRVKRNESDLGLQGLLEEALQTSGDIQLLRELARQYFHSLEIGGPIMRRLVAISPADDEAMALLASLHAMHIEIEPAREWANRALKVNPKNLEALYALSQTYFEPQKRLDIANDMLRINPRHGLASRMKAEALHRLKRVDEARALLSEHLTLLATDPNATDEIAATKAALTDLDSDPDAAAAEIARAN